MNRLLWVGSFLFMILVYQLGIKKTITGRAQLISAQVSETEKNTIARELADLRTRESQLNRVLHNPDKMKLESEVEQVSLIALNNDVQVQEILDEQLYSVNANHIIYQTYVFSGPFINLVKFLNEIETSNSVSLVYAAFKKVKKKSETVLALEIVTVYVEQYKL